MTTRAEAILLAEDACAEMTVEALSGLGVETRTVIAIEPLARFDRECELGGSPAVRLAAQPTSAL